MKSTRKLLAAAGVVSLALTLVACGSDTDDTATPAVTTTAATASAPFGAACSVIPAEVATAAPTVGAADAAAAIPALSTLAGLVKSAGLGETLNTTQDLTIFAPTNDAFAKVDKTTLDSLAADPTGALANVLKYHVVAGQLTPEQLPGPHTTLEGKDLTVTGSGETFSVNGTANIVCGNVKVKNATVYVIDGVLIPPTA